MHSDWEESRRAFADAADWVGQLVSRVGDRWDQPGLGEWDVRALVGHTSRSFLTVETYLGQPAAHVEVATPGDYYRAARRFASGPEVTARGNDAGRALGADPADAFAVISARVLDLVGTLNGTELLTCIVGGIRLSDYLPTRTFELTVHGADLATALSEPVAPPSTAAHQALRIVEDLAVAEGRGGLLLLAATGRQGLPVGFSVL